MIFTYLLTALPTIERFLTLLLLFLLLHQPRLLPAPSPRKFKHPGWSLQFVRQLQPRNLLRCEGTASLDHFISEHWRSQLVEVQVWFWHRTLAISSETQYQYSAVIIIFMWFTAWRLERALNYELWITKDIFLFFSKSSSKTSHYRWNRCGCYL